VTADLAHPLLIADRVRSAQCLGKYTIAWRQGQCQQFHRGDPAKLLVFQRPHLAGDFHANELDLERRSGVPPTKDVVPELGQFDPELLLKLPPGCVSECLARLELSAREFPQAAMAFVPWPKADEIPSLALNYGC
jgi:hypothetical protein